MRLLVATVLILFAGMLPATAAPGTSGSRPVVAIIIDDLGHRMPIAQRVIAFPVPVACAVLPDTPHAGRIAARAREAGKEVLLHLPLQAVGSAHGGHDGELTLDTTQRQFELAVARHLSSVPHLDGVNTHRGSLLTRHPGHMGWLMDVLSREAQLFFVDSYTTAESVALRLARERGIPSTRRDVFIDADPSEAGVRQQFRRLKRLARERGSAVGIGHPTAVTVAFLEQALPALEDEGIDVVTVESVIRLQSDDNFLQDRLLVNAGVQTRWR